MKVIFALFALLAIFSASSTVKAQDCGTCELVMGFVEQWVENNATESQILQYLDTICSLFPSYQSTCDAVAEQGIAQIITWIQANETPETICTQLGACSSSKKATHYKSFEKISKPTQTKINVKVPTLQAIMNAKVIPSKPLKKVDAPQDVQCSGCMEVIGVIENWLDQANNQQEVITAVEVVCTYMPDWETTCDAMIAMGIPQVVNWIDNNENATVVCNQLGLCGSQKVNKVIHVTDDCGECSQVIAMVENYLSSNTSVTAIENYVNIACTYVPQWTQMCEQYIDGEIPQIVAYIEANEDATTICTQIGLCSSKKVNIN